MALVPKTDLATYVGTLVLAVPFAMRALGMITMSGETAIWLFPCFCFLLGICFVEVLRTFRRVF